MKTEKEIIAQLHTLQSSVVPSEKLHNRIALLGQHLPEHTPARGWFGMYGPALIFAMVLLMVATGSQIMVSANQSKPGSFLYPVKKAVIQTQIHFTQSPFEKEKLEQEILLVTPTATPTPAPTARPTTTPTPEKEHGKKDVEGVHIVQITLTPIPRNNEEHHENVHWQQYVPSQSIENFLNHQNDDNSDQFILKDHEF